MSIRSVRLLIASGVVLSLGVAGGCAPGSGGSGGNDGNDKGKPTLTVYTDQHPEVIKSLTKQYTKKTGVHFKIQDDASVGQIEAEGKASPTDVFMSEDPGPVAQLAKKDKLATLDTTTMHHVRPHLSSDDNKWVAYAARTRILYYNPKKINKTDLPKKLLDVTKPQYKGKFAWAPSGAFVATTQYLIDSIGKNKTKQFLTAIKKNGVNEHKNGNVRDTVESGTHAMGISNHYYWWKKAAEIGGKEKMTSKSYNFPTKDPGNLILSSGAAVMKSSKHQKAAAKFISWVTKNNGGQKLLAKGSITNTGAQYPVAKGVRSKIVGDISAAKSPHFDMDILANQKQAENMIKHLGMSN